MERYSLLAGLVLISANVFGMQNHPAFDDRYFGLGLTLNDLRVSIKHDKSSDAFNDHFMKAVQKNDIETVKKFLGLDVETIKNMVSRSNNSEALQKNLGRYVYIRTRTDVNTQDKNGNTPLMWAVRNGNQEMINLLLGCKDVDVSVKNKEGNSALDFVIMRGCMDMLNSKTTFQETNQILKKNIDILQVIGPKKWGVIPTAIFDLDVDRAIFLKHYINEIHKLINIREEKWQKMVNGAENLLNSWNKNREADAWNLVCHWYNGLKTDFLKLGMGEEQHIFVRDSIIDRSQLETEYRFGSSYRLNQWSKINKGVKY